jgi:hypothetical protein
MASKAKAKKAKPGRTLVHSVRWDTDEFRRIEARAKQLSEETRLRMAPQDVVRIAVRAYLEGSDK